MFLQCSLPSPSFFSFPSPPLVLLVLSFLPSHLFSPVFLCFPLSFCFFPLPPPLPPVPPPFPLPPPPSSAFKNVLVTIMWLWDQVVTHLQMKILDHIQCFPLQPRMCLQCLGFGDVHGWTDFPWFTTSSLSIFLCTHFLRTVILSLHSKYERVCDITSPPWTHFANEVILLRILSATCLPFSSICSNGG